MRRRYIFALGSGKRGDVHSEGLGIWVGSIMTGELVLRSESAALEGWSIMMDQGALVLACICSRASGAFSNASRYIGIMPSICTTTAQSFNP